MKHDAHGRTYLIIKDRFELGDSSTAINKTGSIGNDGKDTTYIEYDRIGRIIQEVSNDGKQKISEYDNLNRTINVIIGDEYSQGGIQTSNIYDSVGNLVYTKTTEGSSYAGGIPKEYEKWNFHDLYNRSIASIERIDGSAGRAHYYRYDSNNNIIYHGDANSVGAITLDSLDLYDQFSGLENYLPTLTVNTEGVETVCTYDMLGNLTYKYMDASEIGGLAIVNKWEYDRNSRAVDAYDGRMNKTHYEYDMLNRVERIQRADYTNEYIDYDHNGNVIKHVDANYTQIEYDYDELNRMTSLDCVFSSADIEKSSQNYVYNGLGKVIQSTDSNLTISSIYGDYVHKYYYDSLGNILEEEQSFNNKNAVISRSFNSGNRIVNLIYPLGNPTGFNINYYYGTDPLKRVLGILSGSNSVAAYDYTGLTIDTRTIFTQGSNQLISQYDYDGLNRTNYIKHFTGSSTHLELEYLYDNSDDLLYEQRFNRDTMELVANMPSGDVYFYDVHDRLNEARYQAEDVEEELASLTPDNVQDRKAYDIDKTGNWFSLTGLTGGPVFNQIDSSMNEYTEFQGIGQTHYDDGQRNSDAGHNNLYYDTLNRLVTVWDDDDPSKIIARYVYGANNYRISKITYNSSGAVDKFTYYFYDGPHCIEERIVSGQDTQVNQYIYGTSIDNIVAMRRDCGVNLSIRYYLEDRLGSIRGLVDENGDLVERYKTDIYGDGLVVEHRGVGENPPVFDIDPIDNEEYSLSQEGNTFYFQGRRYDEESGYYYFRNRYFDPSQGRFITHDPIGIWGDAGNNGNAFIFGNCNSLKNIDPFGLAFLPHGNIDFVNKVKEDLKLFEKALRKTIDEAKTEEDKEKAQKCLDDFIELRDCNQPVIHINNNGGGGNWFIPTKNKKTGERGGKILFDWVKHTLKDMKGSHRAPNHIHLSHEIMHAIQWVIHRTSYKQLNTRKGIDVRRYTKWREIGAIKFENNVILGTERSAKYPIFYPIYSHKGIRGDTFDR